jgi:prepilin-type N-terminal cleavage/methylation domain-containing protein
MTTTASRRASRGVTLTELMVAIAIMGIISAGLASMFAAIQRNYSSEDARNGIKTAAETSINKIALNLTATKRVFQNTAADNSFLALASVSPSALAGSVLPGINDGASMSPSSSTFVASAVGNSLFFASLDLPFITSPVIADSSASTHTIRIDSYHFNYYYLSQSTAMIVGGSNQIMLREWHSFSVADYPQIAAWTDGILLSNLVKALYASGYRYAWDSSQTATSSAFYSLSSGGALAALASAPSLTQNSAGAMISPLTGILGAGYRYGVSPNTSASFNTPYAVPEFGTASGSFPSGFEVVVVGSSSARQVLMRLVVVAQGAFKGYIANQQVTVATARDIH